jgi:dGTPase
MKPNLKPNPFYMPFDEEICDICGKERNPDSDRTQFERDRDRIIHSYAFRRLQAKTQVFKTGEYDFYRTRLTHTIEVAQIGTAVSERLRRTSPHLRKEDFYIDADLVEAVCLAHDLGHPPFGHGGEGALNELMKDFGGFEGNAQTLRLLTETMWHASPPQYREGISPTRALVDGVLKYKKTRSSAGTRNHFVYDEQEKYVAFVHDGLPDEFRARKSIECQIMDWADEVAYSVGDFVDGVHAGFITTEKLSKWSSDKRHPELVQQLLGAMEKGDLSEFAANKIGEFIKCCSLVDSSLPRTDKTNRYRYDLDVCTRRSEQECLAQISRDLVFAHPGVQQLEYKAQCMITQLFGILRENYIFPTSPKRHLLNRDMERAFEGAKDKREAARRLCDYISGMSDDYITRACRRLTEPEFGSIVDLV